MNLSFTLNKKFIRETQLLLSGDALRLYLMLNWEWKYPRRRISQRNPILEKAGTGKNLWVDDQEIAAWLEVSLEQVENIRQELIANNLIYYTTPTGIKMDRSLIGYYTLRRMR